MKLQSKKLCESSARQEHTSHKFLINLYSDTVWYVDRLDEWVKKKPQSTQEVPQEADLLALVQSLQIPVHKLLLIGTSAEIQK